MGKAVANDPDAGSLPHLGHDRSHLPLPCSGAPPRWQTLVDPCERLLPQFLPESVDKSRSMEQPPPTSPGAAERPILVRIDVADVGDHVDPAGWEALNHLEGLLETLLEDLGGSVIDSKTDAFVVNGGARARDHVVCSNPRGTPRARLAHDHPCQL